MPFVGINAAARLFSVTRVSLMAAVRVESRTRRYINLISAIQVVDGKFLKRHLSSRPDSYLGRSEGSKRTPMYLTETKQIKEFFHPSNWQRNRTRNIIATQKKK